jgi:hypothetical protein
MSRLALSPKAMKQDSTWPMSPSSSIVCVQNDFWAYGMFGTNSAPLLHLRQHCLQMDRNKIPHDPRHLGVSSGVSKTIFKPMVCTVQTVHLSCVKISTMLKRTKMSFRLSLIAKEYHRVHLKRFRSLWYVRRKPCTYLASRLALSPYTLKQDATWPTSPSYSIVCLQNDFLSLWYVPHKQCTCLAPTLTLSPKRFLSLWYFGANRASILHQQ